MSENRFIDIINIEKYIAEDNEDILN